MNTGDTSGSDLPSRAPAADRQASAGRSPPAAAAAVVPPSAAAGQTPLPPPRLLASHAAARDGARGQVRQEGFLPYHPQSPPTASHRFIEETDSQNWPTAAALSGGGGPRSLLHGYQQHQQRPDAKLTAFRHHPPLSSSSAYTAAASCSPYAAYDPYYNYQHHPLYPPDHDHHLYPHHHPHHPGDRQAVLPVATTAAATTSLNLDPRHDLGELTGTQLPPPPSVGCYRYSSGLYSSHSHRLEDSKAAECDDDLKQGHMLSAAAPLSPSGLPAAVAQTSPPPPAAASGEAQREGRGVYGGGGGEAGEEVVKQEQAADAGQDPRLDYHHHHYAHHQYHPYFHHQVQGVH